MDRRTDRKGKIFDPSCGLSSYVQGGRGQVDGWGGEKIMLKLFFAIVLSSEHSTHTTSWSIKREENLSIASTWADLCLIAFQFLPCSEIFNSKKSKNEICASFSIFVAGITSSSVFPIEWGSYPFS